MLPKANQPGDKETTAFPERHRIRKKTRECLANKQTGPDCGCGCTCRLRTRAEQRLLLHRHDDDSSRPLPPRVYFRDHKSSTLLASVCLALSCSLGTVCLLTRGKHLCINTSSLDDDLSDRRLVVNTGTTVVAARWMNQPVPV